MAGSLNLFFSGVISIHRILGCTATTPTPPTTMSGFYLIPESYLSGCEIWICYKMLECQALFVYGNVCMYVCMCYFSVILVLF